MLARRTGLPMPSWYTESRQEEDQLLSTLKLIGGAAVHWRVHVCRGSGWGNDQHSWRLSLCLHRRVGFLKWFPAM